MSAEAKTFVVITPDGCWGKSSTLKKALKLAIDAGGAKGRGYWVTAIDCAPEDVTVEADFDTTHVYRPTKSVALKWKVEGGAA